MGTNPFATPVIVSDDNVEALERVSLQLSSEHAGYNEDWVQDLVFRHPGCLPVAEIDATCSRLTPICRELNTPAGPIGTQAR